MDFPKLSKGDYVVLVVAILVVAYSFVHYWQGMAFANQAFIHIHGKYWQTVDLYQNQIVTVKGSLGESKIEVSDGRVRFIESPCQNKICIHQGWLQHGGEVAACLPNEVSVQVSSPDPLYDSMNF